MTHEGWVNMAVRDPQPGAGRAGRLWRRVPVLIRAVLTGLLVSSTGVATWVILAELWRRHPADVLGIPWAAPATACFLGVYGWYLSGRGWPRSTAAARRRDFRAFGLPAAVWRWSLLAGSLASVAMAIWVVIFPRLTGISWMPVPDVSGLPARVLPLLLMAAVVAGVCEEAGFRGFLQAPLERRYGPVAAILLTGLIFGLAHANHGDWRPATLPNYLLFSLVAGTLAWRTGSILPGMVLHVSIDIFFFLRSWQTGAPVARPTVWETGADPGYWLLCLAAVTLGAASLWAFRKLAGAMKPAEGTQGLTRQ